MINYTVLLWKTMKGAHIPDDRLTQQTQEHISTSNYNANNTYFQGFSEDI